jgi:hypothetical protein
MNNMMNNMTNKTGMGNMNMKNGNMNMKNGNMNMGMDMHMMQVKHLVFS